MQKSNIEYLKGIVYIAYKRKCKAVFKFCWNNDDEHLFAGKWPTNVVSFDENVSYLRTLMNLYERNKHFSMNETRTNIHTII